MGIVGLGAFVVLGTATVISRRLIHLNRLLAVEIEDRQKLHDELQYLASTDPLTAMLNRRAFLASLDKEIQRSARHDRDTCVLIMDVDFFKRVNDEHGHGGGDAVLEVISTTLKSKLREHDMPGRLGGEEFAVCLPETTADHALFVADRIRTAIAGTAITFDNTTFNVTVSIGVAQMLPGETRDSLLKRADAALYTAKRHGRNQVRLAPSSHFLA